MECHDSEKILNSLKIAFPGVPHSILQEKALELVLDRGISQEQVIEQIEEEYRKFQNKISVSSFSSTVNLKECDPIAVEKITVTLQHFRKLRGMSYCSEEISNPDSLIETIKVIGNEAIFERYQQKIEEFTVNKKSTEELFLFHGTSEKNLKEIIKKNFDISAVPIENTPGENPRKKLSVYGSGIYFSSHPCYSSKYGNALILCKVLVGKVQVLDKDSRESRCDGPPLFDSKKINTKSREGLIYVVKNSSQILPFSIITFKDKHIHMKISMPRQLSSTTTTSTSTVMPATVKLSPLLEQVLRTHPKDRYLRDILSSSQLNDFEKLNLTKSHLKM